MQNKKKIFFKLLQNTKKTDIFLCYKINKTITERHLLQPNQQLLIAVSGGQDSIFLLRSLFALKKSWNWKLGIIHCDHQWDKNSKFQAEHVAFLAANLQIDYHQGIAIETVTKERIARIWRYEMMQTIANSNSYSALLSGHNASDQVETLLYNLIRGSGLQGLQSIRWKRNLSSCHFNHSALVRINCSFLVRRLKYRKEFDLLSFSKTSNDFQLIRPLLQTTRSEIRKMVNFWNLPSWSDQTNKNLRISRNRIRHRLIPYIRLHYNGNIDQSLARWAELFQSETLYLEQLVRFLLAQIEIQSKKKVFSQNAIPLDIVRSLPLALQRRLLKQFLYQNIGQVFEFEKLEQLRLSCFFSTYFTTNKKNNFIKLYDLTYNTFVKNSTLFVTKNYLFLFYQYRNV